MGCLNCGIETRANERTGKPLKYCSKKCANKVLSPKYYQKKNPDWGKATREKEQRAAYYQWCCENRKTTKQISEEHNIHSDTVHYRAKVLGLGEVVFGGNKTGAQTKFFTDEEIDIIVNRFFDDELQSKKTAVKEHIFTEEQKERRREYQRKYRTAKRKADPKLRLRRSISSCVGNVLRRFEKVKSGPTFEKLPFTKEQLWEHLEKKFDENMTWDNYGSYWHLDHIIPQAALPYDSMEHPNFKKCWDLKNLQPLEASKNSGKCSVYNGKKYFW